MEIAESEETTTRAGMVAIVGRPNAGKSTLMNALIGERLSIVSEKAQTTWTQVAGLLTVEGAQAVFLDTPGLLEARDLHQRSLLQAAEEAVRDADLILTLIDVSDRVWERQLDLLAKATAGASVPVLPVLNKADRLSESDLTDAVETATGALGAAPIVISALRESGLDALREKILGSLPTGPFLYPADDVGVAPTRFFVAEMIRETVFELYRDEIPYATACVIEEFREGGEPWYIHAVLHVEKRSQKAILVGAGGTAVRDLGRAAREKIEHFLGRSVYLDLWVKVLPNWRRKRHALARLGFRVPPEGF